MEPGQFSFQQLQHSNRVSESSRVSPVNIPTVFHSSVKCHPIEHGHYRSLRHSYKCARLGGQSTAISNGQIGFLLVRGCSRLDCLDQSPRAGISKKSKRQQHLRFCLLCLHERFQAVAILGARTLGRVLGYSVSHHERVQWTFDQKRVDDPTKNRFALLKR